MFFSLPQPLYKTGTSLRLYSYSFLPHPFKVPTHCFSTGTTFTENLEPQPVLQQDEWRSGAGWVKRWKRDVKMTKHEKDWIKLYILLDKYKNITNVFVYAEEQGFQVGNATQQ